MFFVYDLLNSKEDYEPKKPWERGTLKKEEEEERGGLNCYKNSFFIRIVKLWNELPGDIVEADSFQHFKSKLKSYLNI